MPRYKGAGYHPALQGGAGYHAALQVAYGQGVFCRSKTMTAATPSAQSGLPE